MTVEFGWVIDYQKLKILLKRIYNTCLVCQSVANTYMAIVGQE